jgi:hypothetical protein
MTTTSATFRKVQLASWSTRSADPPVPPPYSAASWSTVDDEPPPDDGPGGPLIPGDDGYGYLDTLRTRQDQGRCVPCGSASHRSQQCPLIADILFAR